MTLEDHGFEIPEHPDKKYLYTKSPRQLVEFTLDGRLRVQGTITRRIGRGMHPNKTVTHKHRWKSLTKHHRSQVRRQNAALVNQILDEVGYCRKDPRRMMVKDAVTGKRMGYGKWLEQKRHGHKRPVWMRIAVIYRGSYSKPKGRPAFGDCAECDTYEQIYRADTLEWTKVNRKPIEPEEYTLLPKEFSEKKMYCMECLNTIIKPLKQWM